jgi:tryptophanyl-tRNA synthetase
MVLSGRGLTGAPFLPAHALSLNATDPGLGDAVVKRRLEAVLRDVLGPIRERRAALARDPDLIINILRTGTAQARDLTAATHAEVHAGLGLFTWT